MTVIGVDGCKGGWIVVQWDGHPDGNTIVHIVERFAQIVAMDAEIIAVDMPIGLPDIARNGRGCDGDARRRLKFKPSRMRFADHAQAQASIRSSFAHRRRGAVGTTK